MASCLVEGLGLAEGVGNAPTSARADPVFKTGAASLYLPAFHKWLPGLESHLESHPPSLGATAGQANTERLNRPPSYFDTTWQSSIGAAAGLPPASFRLEGGFLM